ncbi:uncharacterized protein LOC116417138 [Nasonia vitripennis]|uniref:Uncharacterized protein n=1 Tax=Nasonia vitripennis TaxID=7425 RepID=A0A7M7QEN0_NASVI|nr:uncharacterized protein LOC116417138 [Nasonia vitripennis]
MLLFWCKISLLSALVSCIAGNTKLPFQPISKHADFNSKTLVSCFRVVVNKTFDQNIKTFALYFDDDIVCHRIFITLHSKSQVFLSKEVLKMSMRRKGIVILIRYVHKLYKYFNETFLSIVYARYLVVTDIHVKELLELTNVLRKNNFTYVVFLSISTTGSVSFSKFNYEKMRANQEISLDVYNCETDLKNESLTSNFATINCPIRGCSLTYLRVNEGVQFSNGLRLHRNSRGRKILEMFGNVSRIKYRDYNNDKLSWDRAVELLKRGEIDIIYGSDLPSGDKQILRLDFTGSYGTEKFVFIDKISYERLNYVTNFLAPFKWKIWLCMILSVALYSAYICLLQNYYRIGLTGEYLRIMDAYAVMFNQTFRLPNKSAFRFIVIIWILGNMITNLYYQSELKSYIIVTKEIKLESFLDVMLANRQLGDPSFIRDILEDYDNETVMHILYKRYRNILPNEMLSALQNNTIIAFPKYLILDLVDQYNEKSNKSINNIYTLKQIVAEYPLILYLQHGHPYLSRLSQILSRTAQGGLLKFNDEIILDKEGAESSETMLDMKQIILAFELLVVGCAISTACFMYVLFVCKIKSLL